MFDSNVNNTVFVKKFHIAGSRASVSMAGGPMV